MPRCGPGDIFATVLFSLYVALHISAFAIGIHALKSPANCNSETGVGMDLVGNYLISSMYNMFSFLEICSKSRIKKSNMKWFNLGFTFSRWSLRPGSTSRDRHNLRKSQEPVRPILRAPPEPGRQPLLAHRWHHLRVRRWRLVRRKHSHLCLRHHNLRLHRLHPCHHRPMRHYGRHRKCRLGLNSLSNTTRSKRPPYSN